MHSCHAEAITKYRSRTGRSPIVMMGGMAIWMVLGLLVVAAVIGGAIYLAIRAGVGEGGRADAKATLRGRLAAGEISAEEYRERTAALGDSSPPTPAGDGRDT